MIEIQYEKPEHFNGIRHVNKLAFEGKQEADIVDALRNSGESIISLVALKDDSVIGHINFSPVRIESEGSFIMAVGLGPMAVLPEYQLQGIGSRLVEKGLRECQAHGYPVVVVLGHSGFYPRFGFVPSKPLGIEWEKDVPEEVFMVAELKQGALDGITGTVKYPKAFD